MISCEVQEADPVISVSPCFYHNAGAPVRFAADDLETPAPETEAAADTPAEPAADQAEDPGEIGEEVEGSEPVLSGAVDDTLDADAEPAQEQEGE